MSRALAPAPALWDDPVFFAGDRKMRDEAWERPSKMKL